MSAAELASPPARVWCVVPVHNRLAITQRFVAQFRQQDHGDWRLVIVDDGSKDGTGEWLSRLDDPRIEVITGTGDLWWGGAMNLGLSHVFAAADERDYLLMLNDDVRIEPQFVSALLRASEQGRGAVVGATQRFEPSGRLFGGAYRIDYLRMRFEILEDGAKGPIDALPGRGVLFPVSIARPAGVIHRGLPHHLGDLEYTARVRERGARLLVSAEAQVLTEDLSPAEAKGRRRALRRWFGKRSADNFWQRLVFFHSRGPWPLRLTAAPRYFALGLLRRLGIVK